MKKYIIIALLISLFSCGGNKGGGSTPSPTPKPNTAPTIPVLASPANNSLCINNEQTFSWQPSTDAEKDAISYEIQLASNNAFTNNLKTISVNTNSKLIVLDKGKAYYWRVRAKDSKGLYSKYSSFFQLYTEGEGKSNHLPFLPQIITPAINSIVKTNKVTLKWSANDADNDPLTYDVYLEENNPPTKKVATNTSKKEFTIEVQPYKNYFWYIVVKDNKGGITKGQIWNFKTD